MSPYLESSLYLVRTLEGYKRPLAYPTKGLDFKYMLDLAQGNDYSIALFMVVHSLPHKGWGAFSCIHEALDTFNEFHTYTVALLGYDPSNQIKVVEKIQAFIKRMTHIFVANMVQMHHDEQLT